jgi:hypothetical protein
MELLPASPSAHPKGYITLGEFSRMNARRIELTQKESTTTLTDLERKELEGLKQILSEHVDLMHPLPFGMLEDFEGRTRTTLNEERTEGST